MSLRLCALQDFWGAKLLGHTFWRSWNGLCILVVFHKASTHPKMSLKDALSSLLLLWDHFPPHCKLQLLWSPLFSHHPNLLNQKKILHLSLSKFYRSICLRVKSTSICLLKASLWAFHSARQAYKQDRELAGFYMLQYAFQLQRYRSHSLTIEFKQVFLHEGHRMPKC